MRIISSLPLTAPQWDIAATGYKEAVVNVLDESKSFILDISVKQVSIRRTLELSFGVFGLPTYKDKLVVASLGNSPPSVKLTDQSSQVY